MIGNFYRKRKLQTEERLSLSKSLGSIVAILPKKLKSIATLGLALALSLFLPCVVFSQEDNDSGGIFLDTIVVTATRSEEKLREVTTSITVVDEAQIEASTANNLTQLLTQQGLYVQNSGSTQLLKIRGMGQNSMSNEIESNVLILVNGRRTGINNVNVMGLGNVERVEIIKGPSAVQYGSSAMAGVVNIITKRGVDQEFQAVAEVGFGSFDLIKESLFFSGSKNGFDFSAGIEHFNRDDFEIYSGETFPYTAVDTALSSNFDIGYTFFDNHRLGVSLTYYDVEDDWGGDTFYEQLENPLPVDERKFSTTHNKNTNVALQYDGGTADNMFTWGGQYASGRGTDVTHDYNDPTDAKAGRPYGLKSEEIDIDTADANISYNGDMASLTLGLDYVFYDLHTWRNSYTSTQGVFLGDYRNMAGYISSKFRFYDEKLILSAGGRYDSYDANSGPDKKTGTMANYSDTNFAPSVGVAYLPAEWVKLRANYSEGFKMGSPKQTAGDGVSYLPNPELRPESSETFEFGVDVYGDYYRASLTYFQTEWVDKHDFYRVPGIAERPYTRFKNLDGASTAGFEFSLSADVGPSLGWDYSFRPYANVNIMTSRETKDLEDIADKGTTTMEHTPKYMVSTGVDFSHPGFDLISNINLSYSSSILSRDYRPGGDSDTYVELGNTTVVDASVEKGIYDFNDKNKLRLRLEVNNIFNSENEARVGYFKPGRNFYVGLKYNYN